MRRLGWLPALLLAAAAGLLALRERMAGEGPRLLPEHVPVRRPPPPPPPPPPLELPAELAGLLRPRLLAPIDRPELNPLAIVLHSTSGLSMSESMDRMNAAARAVHVLVDAGGAAWLLAPLDRQGRAARGMDDVAIHVAVEGGVGASLLENAPQFETVSRVVALLAGRFQIFASNHDVASRGGIFSHAQCKARFGGLRLGERRGEMEPGEAFVEAVLRRIGGTYFPEEKWKARTADGWCLVHESSDSTSSRGALTKGRELTPRPKAALSCVERDRDGLLPEGYRMKYVDRGRVSELRGIVLHTTWTETLGEAVEAFESRRLGPHLIVDTDGRAYQLVDSLEDLVVAAGGTNEWCVQIEIVGRGQEGVLANEAQLAKVAELVRELAGAYSIPLTNADISERRGVFSHGQAKKRWGRSATLWGTDFDPGERLMQAILERAGGTYVPEKDWTGRASGEWVIEPETWLP